MNGLADRLVDYLAMRRALGFKLEHVGLLLDQFVSYLDTERIDTITINAAVSWAAAPSGGSPGWHAQRLSAVPGFAGYLHAFDPAVEVPPAGVVAGRPRRAVPFLYSAAEIASLIDAAATLHQPLRVTTYQTMFGLLAVTGMLSVKQSASTVAMPISPRAC